MKNKFFIPALLVIFVAVQAVFSLFFPAYGSDCWYSFSDILSKSQKYPVIVAESASAERFFGLFENYRINCDKGFIFG